MKQQAEMVSLDDFVDLLDGVRDQSGGYLALCPAHDDRSPSLSIRERDDDHVSLHCFAGCDNEDIMQAVGLTLRDLARMTASGEPPAPRDFTTPRTPRTPRASRVSQPRVQREPEPVGSTDLEALQREVARACDELDASVTDQSNAAFQYANARWGVGIHHVKAFGLGYKRIKGGNRVLVPFHTPTADGDLIVSGWQARAISKEDEATGKWWSAKNPLDGGEWSRVAIFDGRGLTYPYADANRTTLLICEGPGDALTCATTGQAALGVRGASNAPTPGVIARIVAWAHARGLTEAIVAGDGDSAGAMYTHEMTLRLQEAGMPVRILNVPDGEDLTSLRESDPDTWEMRLQELIGSATPAEPATDASEQPQSRIDPWRHPNTDLGGARHLRDWLENDGTPVLHCADLGGFLIYDHGTGTWRKDAEDARIRRACHAIGDELLAYSRTLAATDGADTGESSESPRIGYVKRLAERFQSSRVISSILKELSAVVAVRRDEFDGPHTDDLLACANGVVNLRTGQLSPHDPALKITRGLGVAFDANATAQRWERFLTEIFPGEDGPDLARYLQGYFGVSATGHTEQAILFLHGGGANGKSVLLNTIADLLGEHSRTARFTTFEAGNRGAGDASPDLARLRGSRLVVCSEIESNALLSEAVIKGVTGGEKIVTRALYQEEQEWLPKFQVIVATNTKPGVHGSGDYALWRRLKLVPFERQFEPHERDPKLGARLREELPGILAWVVAGARQWYAEGLVEPERVTLATEGYKESANPLDGFLPGLYEVDGDPEHTVDTTALWNDFRSYIGDNNYIDLARWSTRRFHKTLEGLGVVKRKVHGGKRVFAGLVITDEGLAQRTKYKQF